MSFIKGTTMAVCLKLITCLGLICGLSMGDSDNLALHKPANVSSQHIHYGASYANDGNNLTNIVSGTCTHSGWENKPWWTVDLGQIFTVENVRIFNRQNTAPGGCDGCSDRLVDFQVYLSDALTSNTSSRYQVLCYQSTETTLPLIIEFQCNKLVSGRFLTVSLPRREYLTLCEVQVFGKVPDKVTTSFTTEGMSTVTTPADSITTSDPGIYSHTPPSRHTTDENTSRLSTVSPSGTVTTQSGVTSTEGTSTMLTPAASTHVTEYTTDDSATTSDHGIYTHTQSSRHTTDENTSRLSTVSPSGTVTTHSRITSSDGPSTVSSPSDSTQVTRYTTDDSTTTSDRGIYTHTPSSRYSESTVSPPGTATTQSGVTSPKGTSTMLTPADSTHVTKYTTNDSATTSNHGIYTHTQSSRYTTDGNTSRVPTVSPSGTVTTPSAIAPPEGLSTVLPLSDSTPITGYTTDDSTTTSNPGIYTLIPSSRYATDENTRESTVSLSSTEEQSRIYDGTTVNTSTVWYTNQYVNTTRGPCECSEPNCFLWNTDNVTKEAFIAGVLYNLQIDEKNVSRERNRYASVPDNRQSAQIIGSAGLVFIVLLFGSIVISDAVNLVRYVASKLCSNYQQTSKASKA